MPYQNFSKFKYNEIKKQGDKRSLPEMAKSISEEWRSLTKEQQAKWRNVPDDKSAENLPDQ